MQPELIGYWEGYSEQNVLPYPLNQVPTNVTYIPIAFIAPSSDGVHWSPGISTQTYDLSQIQEWTSEIAQRQTGQQVLFSLMDTPTTHWNQINIDAFAPNIALTVIEWNGLAGVDIDAESGMDPLVFADTYIHLIKALRNALGPNKTITYVTYLEGNNPETILSYTRDDLDLVSTMAYWDNLSEAQQLFQYYANIVGSPEKIVPGVACMQTSLTTVDQIGSWLKSIGQNKMMLWSLTQDVTAITGQPDSFWLESMYNSLS